MQRRPILAVPISAVIVASSAITLAANNALDFDGAGDNVLMASQIPSSAAGTIMAWTYPRSYDLGPNQLNLVIGQGDNLQLGLGDSSLSADGQWVFRLHDGGFRNAVGPLVTLDEWIHVAATWDGVDIVLYLDGVEEARVAAGTPIGPTSGLKLGSHPYADQNYWDGLVDEVSLWNIALTQPEIADLMNQSLGPQYYGDPASGLILYLPCDEDPGSPTVFDWTASHNDGTLYGDTDFVPSEVPPPLFADDFESGDTTAWSSATP